MSVCLAGKSGNLKKFLFCYYFERFIVYDVIIKDEVNRYDNRRSKKFKESIFFGRK